MLLRTFLLLDAIMLLGVILRYDVVLRQFALWVVSRYYNVLY